MRDLAGLPYTTTPTANRDRGDMSDVSVPGGSDGTPLRKDWISDLWYMFRSVLHWVGLTPDDSVEGIVTGQFIPALRAFVRTRQTLDANTTFGVFKVDQDIYYTCTANRTADIQAGATAVGDVVNFYNNASGNFTLIITYAVGKTATLTRDKFISFKWTGSKWTVNRRSIIGKSDIVDFLSENMLQKSGQLVNRADYPALWHHVNTHLSPTTEALWSSGSVGEFSTGDLSTTFRLPDTRGLFPRFADMNSIMKLADAVTYFNGGVLRSVANDLFQGHRMGLLPNGTNFVTYGTPATGLAITGGGAIRLDASTGSPVTDGTNGTPRIGKETAPARTSMYHVVYFED